MTSRTRGHLATAVATAAVAVLLACGCASGVRTSDASGSGASADGAASDSSGADASGSDASGSGAEATYDGPKSAWEIEPDGVVSAETIEYLGEDALFVQEPIPDDVFARMEGHSFKDDGTVSRDDLRYLRILHRDANGKIMEGEMVCNASISDDLLRVMRELYDGGFPIERMRLVDDYYAAEATSAYDPVSNDADTASMEDDNSSCFNYRLVTGATTTSNHATGTAVDINTLYNPYVILYKDEILPSNGERYADRSVITPYTITEDGLCVRTFKKYGFSWGGDWTGVKDYQHFERP